MTKHFQVYLFDDATSVKYSCVNCRAHLSDHKYLISKSFQGSQGRAYLFDKVVNVKTGVTEDRLLLTGQHRVADLHCSCCGVLLGWKYEKAFEPSQRYKEGKCIIELTNLIKENGWDDNLTPQMKRRSSGYYTAAELSPMTPHRHSAEESSDYLGGWSNRGFFDSSKELSRDDFFSTEQSVTLPSTSFADSHSLNLLTFEKGEVVIDAGIFQTTSHPHIPTSSEVDQRGNECENRSDLQSASPELLIDLFIRSGTCVEQQPANKAFSVDSFALDDDYSRSSLFAPWDLEMTYNSQSHSLLPLSLGDPRRSDRLPHPDDQSLPLVSATVELLCDVSGDKDNTFSSESEKRLYSSPSLDNIFLSAQASKFFAKSAISRFPIPTVSDCVIMADMIGESSRCRNDNPLDSNSHTLIATTDSNNEHVFSALH